MEGCYAGRYQVWKDLKARVRRVNGPFSPKMFDGDYLSTEKKWIEDKLQNNGFGADHHYSVGRKMFKNVDCHVALAENEHCIPSKISQKLREDGITVKEYSLAVKQIRGRVEEPFGFVKTKFKSLGKKWAESEEQHAKVIKYALAVYNCKMSE
jgi:hypothetical protein